MPELKKFFVILYLLGLNGVPNMRDAWGHAMYLVPLVKEIMTRHLFEDIMANWHYIDTSRVSLEEQEKKKRRSFLDC